MNYKFTIKFTVFKIEFLKIHLTKCTRRKTSNVQNSRDARTFG